MEQQLLPETFGLVSAAIVACSGAMYAVRCYQSAIRPNITSWSLWTIIGLVLLVTYRDSGAEANIWAAVIGAINPAVILAIAIYRRSVMEPLTGWEKASIILGTGALALWWHLQGQKELMLYALLLSIFADMCAVVPTYIGIIAKPESDRPGMWAMYGVGYGISAFAVTNHTFANYVLPAYMFFGALGIAAILAWHRVKRGIPVSHWI